MLFAVAARKWMETNPEWRPKTRELHEFCLQHLTPVFGDVLLTDITPDDIAHYQAARLREAAAPRSINIEVGTLRSMLIKQRLWGNIGPDVNLLKEPRSAGRALQSKEQELLLAECRVSCNRQLYPIVEVALNTGLRSDEIRQLRWAQIDFGKKWLQVGHSKTAHGENRVVPINRRLAYVLQLWAERFPERKPQHFVFPFEKSGAIGADETFGFVTSKAYATDPRRPIGSWKKSWVAACKRAGFKLRFHDLRHTAVTNMLEAGVDLERVARVVGWSPSTTVEMARRYGHLCRASLASAVEALGSEIDREGVQNWVQSGQGVVGQVQ